MRRDRITFAMMLGVPLLQLMLFGFAINNDPKALPAALVTASHDPLQPGDGLGAGADRLLPLQPRHRQRRGGRGADPARRRRLRRHDPVGLRGAGGARRPAADPRRGRRDRPGGGERGDLDARDRGGPGAAARDRRRGGGGRGGGRAARGGGAPALQPRGRVAVQHRAGAARGHPADDHGDDDLDGADPRDRARDDGEPARDAVDGDRGDAVEDPALPRGRRGAGDGGAARGARAVRTCRSSGGCRC